MYNNYPLIQCKAAKVVNQLTTFSNISLYIIRPQLYEF